MSKLKTLINMKFVPPHVKFLMSFNDLFENFLFNIHSFLVKNNFLHEQWKKSEYKQIKDVYMVSLLIIGGIPLIYLGMLILFAFYYPFYFFVKSVLKFKLTKKKYIKECFLLLYVIGISSLLVVSVQYGQKTNKDLTGFLSMLFLIGQMFLSQYVIKDYSKKTNSLPITINVPILMTGEKSWFQRQKDKLNDYLSTDLKED